MDEQQIVNTYTSEKKSLRQVASKYNTTVNRVYNIIRKANVLRNKSDANKGKPSTMKGKKHSPETLRKISVAVHKKLKNMDESVKANLYQRRRELWHSRSKEEQADFNKQSARGRNQSSRLGSKLEHFLQHALTSAGFVVYLHQEGYVPNSKIHFDLFLPDLMTVIEIDGPFHYKQVFTDHDSLSSTKRSDMLKEGVAATQKMRIVRVKQQSKTLSKFKMTELADKVIKLLETFRVGDVNETKFELEV
jgi:hypothetical protein